MLKLISSYGLPLCNYPWSISGIYSFVCQIFFCGFWFSLVFFLLFKIACHNYKIFCKLQSSHRSKTYSKYTKDKKLKKINREIPITKEERNKETKDLWNKQKTMDKMSVVNPSISIITLNVNELTSPIKRQIGWINQNTRPNYILPIRYLLHLHL